MIRSGTSWPWRRKPRAVLPFKALRMRNAAALPVAKRYWRLRFPSGSNHATFLAVSEIEFRTTVGGADVSSSVTAVASSFDSGLPASLAFDNAATNAWFCDDNLQVNSWVGCDLGSDTDLEEITVRGHPTTAAYSPTEIVVDYSPDGSSWTNDTRWPTMTGLTWDTVGGNGGGELKTIRRTDLGVTPTLKYTAPIGILNTNNGAWTNFTIRQPFPATLVPCPAGGSTKLRFAFQSASAEGLAINKCYVQKISSAYGFSTTPVQVQFGGSNSVLIPANTTQYCDDVTLSLSSTDAIVVSAFVPSGASANDAFRALAATGSGATYYKAGDDAVNTAPAGYSTVVSLTMFLGALEVW